MYHSHGALPEAVPIPPECLRQLIAQIGEYKILDQRFVTSRIPSLMEKSNAQWAANRLESSNPFYNSKQMSASSSSSAAERTLAWQEQKTMQSFHDVIDHEALGDLEDLLDDTQQNNYKEYVPKKLHIGKPHPDVLVESSSLAACALPDITYTLLLPKSTIKSGVLSAPQLEAVSYACQTHAQTFITPQGTFRKGFFLGDGAGVGKGRQLAGLIHENWLRGRVKHLWVSVSGDLHLDARRDLDDIGAKKIQCYTMKGLPMKGDRIDVDEGIVFSTYQGLISKTRRSGRKKNVSRMDQLVEWCTGGGSAESFEGCIMLDECHKAKNLYPSKGGMQPTRMGQAVFDIQQRLPRARIVYCSATGCSEPADMGYMTRLGLWGVGTSFPGGFQEFRDAFDQGGIGMMELVAMHLKRQGQYLCRTLSYHGCTFTIDEQALSSHAVSVYDRAAMFWIKLYDQLKHNLNSSKYLDYFDRSSSRGADSDNSADDLELLDSDVKPLSLPKDGKLSKTIILRYYWNSHQRFFRALCIALKVPRAVEISKEALSSGHCVVIGLQSTGQSGVEHHRDVASSNDQTPATDTLEFVSTPAVILQRLVKKLFPLPGLSRPSIPLAPIDSIDIDCKRPRRVTASKAISYAYPTNDEFAVPIGESEDEEEDVRLLPAAVSKKRPLRAQVPNTSSTVRRSPAHGTTKDGINGWSIFHSEGWTLAPMDRLPGSEHIGKAVLKRFRNAQCVDGDVVAFLPAAANEGVSLWHVVWSDGDEEDWDDTEVRIGIKLFADSQSSFSPAAAKPSGRKTKSKLTPQTVSTESSEGSDADEQDSSSSESSFDDAESDAGESAATTALKALQAIRDDFLAQIAEMDLPGNPLDLLVDQLGGPCAVAEMTGRQARFVRDANGSLQFTKRNDGSDVPMYQRNIHERDLFQRGVKRVAIISEAASAGISLHADRRFGDSQRRVHITLELPWAADKAIQQLGRSHRSNQSSAPKYFLLISPQGGERRFAAAVAKRIESLGALTQGDRSATVGAKNMSMTEFNFDTKYGKDAIVKMFQYLYSYNPVVAMPHPLHVLAPELPEELVLEILDEVNRQQQQQRQHSAVPPNPVSTRLSFAEAALHWLGRVDCAPTTADLQTVPRFLNRLLGLPSRWQRLLFDFFFSIMESIIRQAKSEMSYDEGIFEVKGSHIAAKPGYPIAAWRSAALDEVKYFNLRVDRGCSWSEVTSHYTADEEDAARTSKTGLVETPQSGGAVTRKVAHGFFVTRNSYQGKHFVLYVPESGPMQRRPHSVTIMRPTTGRNQMERALFFEKYRAAMSLEEARCLWTEQHEPTNSSSSSSSENANSRYLHHHLFTGSVLSIWSVIQSVYDRFNAGNKWKYAIRVARVTLSERTDSSSSSPDEGEGTLIGVWVPPTRVEEVLKALQQAATR